MAPQTATEASSPKVALAGPKYTAIAELGRGGMATAYLSISQGPHGFNKLLVVKRLRPHLSAEPELLRMFLDEARLAARIDHPNVVQTFEVGVDANDCFIAMEFVDGQSLEHVVRCAKRRAANADSIEAIDAAPGLALNLSLHVIGAILDALHYAHELKGFDGKPLSVVHRDVSPHNVMITYEGHVKLLDFGIAKAADSSAETRTGVIKGKCGYMAPEQFGGPQVDRRADIFAVGVMLWQALADRKMWRGLSDVEIFQRLANGRVPTPSSHAPGVDPVLEAICMKALAADATDRYATAADMRAALDDHVDAHPELRASARELGKYVSELFESDRSKIHALIEAQVAKKHADDAADNLMNLAEYFGNNSATRRVVPVAEPAPALDSGKTRWRFAVAVAALLALAVAALGVVETLRSHVDRPVPAVPANRPADAMLSVHVSPPDAKVLLDGVPLTGSPPSGHFPLDNASHRLSVEAPGFVARTDVVLLDSERVTMDESLEALPTPVVPVPTASQSSARGTAPPSRASTSLGSKQGSSTSPAPPATAEPTASASPPPAAQPPKTPTGPALDKSDPWALPGSH